MATAPIEGLVSLLERGIRFRHELEDRPRQVAAQQGELAEQVARQAILDAQVRDLPALQEYERWRRENAQAQAAQRNKTYELGLPVLEARAKAATPGTPEYEGVRWAEGLGTTSQWLANQLAQAQVTEAERKAQEQPVTARQARMSKFGDLTAAGVLGGRSRGEAAIIAGLTPDEIEALKGAYVQENFPSTFPTTGTGWFAPAVNAALTIKRLKQGWGGSFAPGAELKREDVASTIEKRGAEVERIMGRTPAEKARIGLLAAQTKAALARAKLTGKQAEMEAVRIAVERLDLERGGMSAYQAARLTQMSQQIAISRARLQLDRDKSMTLAKSGDPKALAQAMGIYRGASEKSAIAMRDMTNKLTEMELYRSQLIRERKPVEDVDKVIARLTADIATERANRDAWRTALGLGVVDDKGVFKPWSQMPSITGGPSPPPNAAELEAQRRKNAAAARRRPGGKAPARPSGARPPRGHGRWVVGPDGKVKWQSE